MAMARYGHTWTLLTLFSCGNERNSFIRIARKLYRRHTSSHTATLTGSIFTISRVELVSSTTVQGERPTTTLVLPSNKKTHNSSEKTLITRKPGHINLQKPYWQGQRSAAYKEYYTLLTPNQQSRADQNIDNRRTGNSVV